MVFGGEGKGKCVPEVQNSFFKNVERQHHCPNIDEEMSENPGRAFPQRIDRTPASKSVLASRTQGTTRPHSPSCCGNPRNPARPGGQGWPRAVPGLGAPRKATLEKLGNTSAWGLAWLAPASTDQPRPRDIPVSTRVLPRSPGAPGGTIGPNKDRHGVRTPGKQPRERKKQASEDRYTGHK